MTIRERTFRLVGTSARHLQEAAMLMAPRRASAQHVAYTDWTIGWSYTPRESGGRHLVGSARVDVVVTQTLPRWRPPAGADRALVSSWNELMAALMRHERGHVDIALSGARSLHEAIVGVSHGDLREDLERKVAAVAEATLATVRAADRDYDVATRHGALQGVRLPW